MSVQKIANLDEFKTLLEKPGLVVVDFTATWCGPCKFIAPKFEELAAAETTVSFAKVDVDEAADVASNQSVRSMPTFKFFKDGQQIAEVIGADIQKLMALVAEHK